MERTFTHTFSASEKPISLTFTTEAGAKEAFWNRYGYMLLNKLAPLRRDGWEATSGIGPWCFEIEVFETDFAESTGKAILSLIIWPLAFTKEKWARPKKFVVTLRK